MGRRVRGRVRLQPLWIRVERNRLRLAFFIAGLLAVAALAAEAILFVSVYGFAAIASLFTQASSYVGEPVVLSLHERVSALLGEPWAVAGAIGVAAALLASAYVLRVLRRPLRKQLASMGVRPVMAGELLDTKKALKDMAIAAGVNPEPELFTLESRSVNAFCIAKGESRPYCVVTTGLVERFSRAEQRAVFANLLARYRAGDIEWATAVSALMAPLWKWRERDFSDRRSDGALLAHVAGDRGGLTYASRAEEDADDVPGAGMFAGAVLGLWFLVVYTLAMIVSELVMFGHRRSHLLSAEAADAEGMLLLKDPQLMLDTLDKAVQADNRVRLGLPAYAQLFYIWAGDDLVDDGDPEWERVARLREVVGVEGIADAEREAADLVERSLAMATVTPPAPPRVVETPLATDEDPAAGRRTEWGGADGSSWRIVVSVGFILGALYGCGLLFVVGSPAIAGRLLVFLPAVACFGGLAMRRAWAGVAVALVGGGWALVSGVGAMAPDAAGTAAAARVALYVIPASAAAGVLGGLAGRAVWQRAATRGARA